MLKIYDEPESPSEGACSRYMINRYRRYRKVFVYTNICIYLMTGRVCDDPESPNEGACVT